MSFLHPNATASKRGLVSIVDVTNGQAEATNRRNAASGYCGLESNSRIASAQSPLASLYESGGDQALALASIAGTLQTSQIDDALRTDVLQKTKVIQFVKGAQQTKSGTGDNHTYDPGSGTYVFDYNTTKGIIALESGSGNTNQFDTATSKIGAGPPTNVPISSKSMVQLRDSNRDEIVDGNGLEVWAVLTDEATEKLYFFSGAYDSTATAYSMADTTVFDVYYRQRFDLDDMNEDGFLSMFVDGEAATIAPDTITATEIAANAITASELADDAVDTAAVVNLAITTAKLAADAVDGTKLADNAVDSEHITAGSVDLAHMSANSVDSDQYVDGSIDTAHYAAGSVDNTALGADSVTGAKGADNAIDSEHYVDGSIDNAHLSANCVTGDELADNAVDSEHYTDGSIDTAHIANLQVTEPKLALAVLSRMSEVVMEDSAAVPTSLVSNGFVDGTGNEGLVEELASPGTAVRVQLGGVAYNHRGERLTVPTSASIGTFDAPGSGNTSNDIVVLDAAGTFQIRAGTPATTGTEVDPTLSAGDVPLARIVLVDTDATVNVGDITDLRERKSIDGSKIRNDSIGPTQIDETANYDFSGSFTTDGRNKNIVSAGDANHTVVAANHIIVVLPTATRTVTLPASPTDGRELLIKHGSDNVNIVTVNGNGKTIDGDATPDLGPRASITIVFSTGLDEWSII